MAAAQSAARRGRAAHSLAGSSRCVCHALRRRRTKPFALSPTRPLAHSHQAHSPRVLRVRQVLQRAGPMSRARPNALYWRCLGKGCGIVRWAEEAEGTVPAPAAPAPAPPASAGAAPAAGAAGSAAAGEASQVSLPDVDSDDEPSARPAHGKPAAERPAAAGKDEDDPLSRIRARVKAAALWETGIRCRCRTTAATHAVGGHCRSDATPEERRAAVERRAQQRVVCRHRRPLLALHQGAQGAALSLAASARARPDPRADPRVAGADPVGRSISGRLHREGALREQL